MNLVFYYYQLSVEKKTEREVVFENIATDEYDTFDELDNLFFKTRR